MELPRTEDFKRGYAEGWSDSRLYGRAVAKSRAALVVMLTSFCAASLAMSYRALWTSVALGAVALVSWLVHAAARPDLALLDRADPKAN